MSGDREISADEIRLVRCPNCGKVLPEIANIPLYQCGGCHTTLQAKNRGRSRTSSRLSNAQPEPTPLQSDGINDNCTEGPVQESNENAQKVDESRSHKESTQNSTTEVSCSDDSSQRLYGGRFCEKGHCRGVSDGCLLVREVQEVDLVESRSSKDLLGINEKKHKCRSPKVQSSTEKLSDTQNPLSDGHFWSRAQKPKAVEGSDGSTYRLYNSKVNRLDNSSGSGSSGELFDSPHYQGTQSSTHSGSVHEEFSTTMLPNSVSNDSDRLQNGDRGFVRPPWNHRHFSEKTNVVETTANGPVFKEKHIGLAPKTEKILGRKFKDFKNYFDHPNQMESEADHTVDQMRPSRFEVQSEMTEMSFDSLASQTNSSQSKVRSQTREQNFNLSMDCQKPSQLEWQSQERERNWEAQRGVKKINDLQSSCSFMSSRYGPPRQLERDGVPGVNERRPHLSRNMPPASDRSDFYNHPRGLLQFNHEDDESEKFDYSGSLSGFHETESFQNEQMEILRKMDELREQLSRSCHASNVRVPDNLGRTFVTPETRYILMDNRRHLIGNAGVCPPADNYEESLNWGGDSVGSEGSLGKAAYRPCIHSIPKVERSCMHRKHYLSHGLMDEQDKELHSKHPHSQKFAQSISRGSYGEKNVVSMPYRIPHASCSGEEQLKDRYCSYSGSYEPVDMSKNSCNPCSRHHSRYPGTGFSQFYHDQQLLYMPSHVSPTVPRHQHMHNAATNQLYSHKSYPSNVRVQAALAHQHPFHSYGERSHGQRSTELETELILNQKNKYAQELVARKWRTLPCSPFVGGAPFVLCDHCLQLLLIPGSLSNTRKRKHRLRCGACYKIFVFTICKKRHSISMAKHANYPSHSIQGNPWDCQEHGIVGAKHASSCNAIQNMLTDERYVCYNPDSHVDDYDVPNSKTHSASGKLGLVSPFPGKPHLPKARSDEITEVCYVQDERGQGHDSLLVTLHDRTSSEALELSRDNSNSTEGYLGPDLASPMVVSPLHELLGYSSPSELINKGLQENTIVASPQKRANLGNSKHADKAFDLNNTKIVNMPTVAVSPPHKYSSVGNSKYTMEREHQEGLSKESGRNWNTTITGFLKKSIRDLKRSNQGSEAIRPKVSVNCRPIPDHLVKKAEEYAGPIYPGDYWYDYHAGFWGVMGGPCLSMIPPFIEEFNYPMPRECAGGKTRVVVNGRELHQKDLELLAGRGLPTTKDKAYHIDISGRVVDKATNKELKSLGKLAPTLEKMGRGVGMRTPRKKS